MTQIIFSTLLGALVVFLLLSRIGQIILNVLGNLLFAVFIVAFCGAFFFGVGRIVIEAGKIIYE